MSDNKKIHIISGGTMFHIRPHLSLCAPAYGDTGDQLENMCLDLMPELNTNLHMTRMAVGSKDLETNEDVERLLDKLIADPSTKIIFMPVAMCDFTAELDIRKRFDGGGFTYNMPVGKQHPRLSTQYDDVALRLSPAQKIIGKIRKERKDIFLVGFKTTTGATEQEQYSAGLKLLKESSCNLVLANDLATRLNMVITPEEAKYHVTKERYEALVGLVEMTKLRSHLTFTRSTVIAGESVPWSSYLVPHALRKVVDHCIQRGAYKPFLGATVGHFAVKIGPTTFLTSKRKTNFNDLERIGLVKIETDGPDSVVAYGSRPSVGGQSQRIVFSEHQEYDCIVHAHVPIKSGSKVPTVSQREFECGSHQCGKNTSNGLKKFGELSAVFLDQHGPNIVFNSSIDPNLVIEFIESNFDLEGKTGGYTATEMSK